MQTEKGWPDIESGGTGIKKLMDWSVFEPTTKVEDNATEPSFWALYLL